MLTATATPNISDDPDYVAAVERFAQLQSELNQTRTALETSRPAPSKAADVATRLANGERFEAIARDMPNEAERQASQAARYEKVIALQRALELQGRRVDETRSAASKRLLDQHGSRQTYADLLLDVHAAASALAEAVERERDFRESLLEGGIEFAGALPACPWRQPIGMADQPSSAL